MKAGSIQMQKASVQSFSEPTTGSNAGNSPQSGLVDGFGRRITYLRISVTDRCNLRCRYCMPAQSPEWMERQKSLSYENIERIIRVAASEGIRKIRITGGEPLVRPGIPELVRKIRGVADIAEITMTTNATLLQNHARELKESGLDRLNISLDSLRRDRFEYISKFDMFDRVWRGIEAALAAGFTPLKLNVVVIRGFNDDEVVDFARLTKTSPFFVRFIEYMPIGGDRGDWKREKVMSCEEILRRIESEECLEAEEESSLHSGPERVYRLKNSAGRIGFISPVSDEFCARCNRVRLTSDGKLRGCLMRDGEIDFREALRNGATDENIRELLHEAMRRKPEKHLINAPDFQHSTFYTMNRLGG